MAEIEIVVSVDGTVTVEAIGVQGPGCQDLTRAIEDALGSVESRECKTAFFEEHQVVEEIQNLRP